MPFLTRDLGDADEVPAEIDPATPSTLNTRAASGDRRSASAGSVNSATPSSMTVLPGRNLSVAGFGVCSVWMNMALCSTAAGNRA